MTAKRKLRAATICVVTVIIATSCISFPSIAKTGAADRWGNLPRRDLSYYRGLSDIRTRSADKDRAYATIIMRVALGYDPRNRYAYPEIVQRRGEISDAIAGYFAAKTAAEIAPQFQPETKKELSERINGLFDRGRIEDLLFLEFEVIPL